MEMKQWDEKWRQAFGIGAEILQTGANITDIMSGNPPMNNMINPMFYQQHPMGHQPGMMYGQPMVGPAMQQVPPADYSHCDYSNAANAQVPMMGFGGFNMGFGYTPMMPGGYTQQPQQSQSYCPSWGK